MLDWLLCNVPLTLAVAESTTSGGGVSEEIFGVSIVIAAGVLGWLFMRHESSTRRLNEQVSALDSGIKMHRLCIQAIWEFHTEPDAHLHEMLTQVVNCLAISNQKNRRLEKDDADKMVLELKDALARRQGFRAANQNLFVELTKGSGSEKHGG